MTKLPKIPETVTAAVLARLFQLSPRRIEQLAAQGIIRRVGRGEYHLKNSMAGYFGWLESEAKQRAEPSVTDRLRERKAQEIEQRMQARERELIPLVDALSGHDDITAAFLESLAKMPALITQNVRERARLERICDESAARLRERFARSRRYLKTGKEDHLSDPA